MNLSKRQDELNLTKGGIVKPLLYLSLSVVATNLLQTMYNPADTFRSGQYPTEALATVSFASPMVLLLISFGMGLSAAGSILVTQHTGVEETNKAEYAASQIVTFAFLGPTMLGAFGCPLVRPFLDFLGASPDVLPGATAYMRVIALSLPFMFGFFVFISLMRGTGNTIAPVLVMFGTVVLSVVLDPFFINGWALGLVQFPRLGIQGAAIATVISRILTMIVGVAIMMSGSEDIQIHPTDMRFGFRYLRKALHIGIPANVEEAGRALSINALLIVVGLFSTSVVTAFDVGTRMFSVIFLPAITIVRGVETMSGQNIGAGKYDRAGQANYVATKGLFFVLGLLDVAIFPVPKPIVSVFATDAGVLEVSAESLRYVSLSFGFIGIMRAFSGGFWDAGKTLIVVIISVVTLADIRLPVTFVASQGLLPMGFWFFGTTDVRGIWIAFFVSSVVGTTIAQLWFRQGTQHEGDVRRSPADGELENDNVGLSGGPG